MKQNKRREGKEGGGGDRVRTGRVGDTERNINIVVETIVYSRRQPDCS
jgi:hypothetical protein